MLKPYQSIDTIYSIAIGELSPYDVDKELYDKDNDLLDYLGYDYINRIGTENGIRVIYWEENYNPSAYKLSENDDVRCKEIFDILEEYGIDFSTDLVAKYPKDYTD